jgi:hypothetical protein
MDIMMPPINEQAAPAPWLIQRAHTDVPRFISELRRREPDVSLAMVAGELRKCNAELPCDVIADLMQRQTAATQ